MKLDLSYTKNRRTQKDAVAYVTAKGNIALHPKYFENSWVGEDDTQWTGYISNGKIVVPDEDTRGYNWDPEDQPLENCFFEGDLLPIIL